MNVSMEIIGQGGLSDDFNDIAEMIRVKVENSLVDAALLVHESAVKSILAKGSGSRTVTRYNPKRQQLVSEPGNPPNSDMGTLVQSIQFEVDKDNLEAYVGTNLKYGLYLEIGTTSTKARPWLLPAFQKNRDQIIDLIREALAVE